MQHKSSLQIRRLPFMIWYSVSSLSKQYSRRHAELLRRYFNILKQKKSYKIVDYKSYMAFLSTGAPGIEPGSGVLETLILPMNYAPIFIMSCTNFWHDVSAICRRLVYYIILIWGMSRGKNNRLYHENQRLCLRLCFLPLFLHFGAHIRSKIFATSFHERLMHIIRRLKEVEQLQ